MKMFSSLAPMLTSNFMQEMAAAPAPRQTICASARVLPAISRALIMPAAVTIAVPCWSSWNTGMSHCSIRERSISKHSGALMSSRLMPPKVMEIRLTVSMKACGLSESTSMSNTSMPAKRLNSTPLPSITGLEANGPRLPRPRIAVPSEIAVLPRGLKFRVELLDPQARGYLAENHGAPLRLPDLGPIGSNGLANPRDFLLPGLDQAGAQQGSGF